MPSDVAALPGARAGIDRADDLDFPDAHAGDLARLGALGGARVPCWIRRSSESGPPPEVLPVRVVTMPMSAVVTSRLPWESRAQVKHAKGGTRARAISGRAIF